MKFKDDSGDPLQGAGDWRGERVLCIAPGPSLVIEDVDLALKHRARGLLKIVAVGDAYFMLPNDAADILYHADGPWWKEHKGVPLVTGRKIVQSRNGGRAVARQFGLECVQVNDGEKPSTDPTWIASGWHSGFQAVNIAALMGATEILMLGFDCQRGVTGKRHFFGDHPPSIRRESPYPLFVAAWDKGAPHYEAAGVSLINCTRRTAIKSIQRRRLEGVLNGKP